MTRYVSTYSKFIASAAVLLLIGYPSLTFAVKGGMNGSFLLILILALAVLMVRPREMQPVVWDGEMKFYLWAMAALPIAVFLSQSYQHHYSGHPYDAVSRFMLAVPVFLLLRRVRMGVVSIVQYGFPLAAIIGFLMMKQNVVGRYATVTMDVIHFGDFELMLGMLSLASLHWTGRDEVLVRILKLTGFVAGCYASVMSGSRGGWLALPLFILLFVHFRFGRVSLKAVGAMLLTLCVAGGIAYMSSQSVEKRIDVMGYDLAGIEQGNLNTSIGVRLQLYH